MKKKTSFKDMKQEEIAKLVGEKREELRTLRFAGRATDANKARGVRKDIARLLTEETRQKKTA